MHVIIPMTGFGSRFVAAGYKDIKPLIKVYGKPIIEWLVKGMFDSADDILFLVRPEQVETIPDLEKTLCNLHPHARMFVIDPWQKKGPVFDVLRASHLIADDEPVVVSYCDYYMQWDWQAFKSRVVQRDCDGCFPCYTGFHPHLLKEQNVYASCLVNEADDLIEVREKYSFHTNKIQAKHLPGLHYFKKGATLKKYYQKLVDDDIQIKGEYYASLPYNAMVQDGLKVWVPTQDIQHFCQWGTPQDLEDFLFWTQQVKGWC